MSDSGRAIGECEHGRLSREWCPICLQAEIDQLKLSIVGRDKAYELLNKGFESTCEIQSELKQRVRELEKKVAFYEKQVSEGCPACNAIANDS